MLILLISFIKGLSLLRCNLEFGRLVQLIIKCFEDVFTFTVFFLSWVMVFSKLFQITGAEFDDADYHLVP